MHDTDKIKKWKSPIYHADVQALARASFTPKQYDEAIPKSSRLSPSLSQIRTKCLAACTTARALGVNSGLSSRSRSGTFQSSRYAVAYTRAHHAISVCSKITADKPQPISHRVASISPHIGFHLVHCILQCFADLAQVLHQLRTRGDI